MAKYRVVLTRQAKEHLTAHRKSGDKAVAKRIDRILAELCEHPETGAGNPERLRFQLSGFWSRRISLEHRIIYRIENDTVEVTVVSAFGHYI